MSAQPVDSDALRPYEYPTVPDFWTNEPFPETIAGVYGAAVLELTAAPGAAFQDRDRARQEALQTAQQIVRGLSAWRHRGGLEIRYGFGGEDWRLRIRVIGRAIGATLFAARTAAQQIAEMAVSFFPPGFIFEAGTAAVDSEFDSWVEVERAEEVRQPAPWVSANMASYYYLPYPMSGDASGWSKLPHYLANLKSPGFLSVALLPTALTDFERDAVDHVHSMCAYLAAPRQEHDYFGNPRPVPGDASAADAKRCWEQWPHDGAVLVRVGISASRSEISPIASTVGAIITQDSVVPSPERIAPRFNVVQPTDFDAWQTANLGIVQPRFNHELWSASDGAPFSLRRMLYLFSEEDAASLLILPIPDADGVPGIRRSARHVTRRPDDIENMNNVSVLGWALHHGSPHGSVGLSSKAVNRHVLIAGAAGYGKTTTIHTLLARLWLEEHIPFLVIEPTKTEYRSLLHVPGMEDLEIYTLGREDISPFRLNPLEPPEGIRREEHANAALAAIKAAIPLPVPLPQLVDEALDLTYERAGWDLDTTVADGRPPPTLRDLEVSFSEGLRKAGYDPEVESNLKAMFSVRLNSLLRGSRGRVVDTTRSYDFARLCRRPVIIELDSVSDADDKAVLSALILARIRATARGRGSASGTLRHVTVVEESHRLLGASADRRRSDSSLGEDSRASAVEAFANAIAELRALGEGFILSSNEPAKLATSAVANCSTRVLHRLQSAADRGVLLDDLDASQVDRQVASRLEEGQALMTSPDMPEPALILVQPLTGIDTGRPVADDTVRDHMGRLRSEQV